jgi:hypothetical protein
MALQGQQSHIVKNCYKKERIVHVVDIQIFFNVLFNNDNSIQFFIIYVPSQQLQGQLQTQHSVDTSNYSIME